MRHFDVEKILCFTDPLPIPLLVSMDPAAKESILRANWRHRNKLTSILGVFNNL